MTLILWFLSPLGRYVGLLLLASAFIGGIYVKGQHDANIRIQEKIVRDSKTAITKADRDRGAAVDQFDAGRLRDDGFARD